MQLDRSAAAAPVGSALRAARDRSLGVIRALEAARPSRVLAVLVLGQLVAIVLFALSVRHNGWLFYQGGDHTWYYSLAWLLGQGEIGPSYVGYGWSLLTAPIAIVSGPVFLDALPWLVAFQVLVFVPAALIGMYALGCAVGGRLMGYAAAALWAAVPFVSIPFFVDRYQEQLTEQIVPQVLGLTNTADFPATVFLIWSAALCLRSAANGSGHEAALAGLLAGFAIAIKPSNAIFLAAPLVAYAVARAFPGIAAFGAGLVLPTATLALWKERGLGEIPAFAHGEVTLAAGAWLTAALPAPIDRYFDPDWGRLWQSQLELEEYLWSARLVEWILVAGALALARRSPPVAALTIAWIAVYVVVKGTYDLSSVQSGSFFRFVMPAFPALTLSIAALPFLLPVVGRRLVEAARRPAPRKPFRPRWTIVSGVVLGVVPLLAVALASPGGATAVSYQADNVFVPTSDAFHLRARVLDDGDVRLDWDHPARTSTTAFYRIFRGTGNGVACTTDGAVFCTLQMSLVENAWRDDHTERVEPGAYVYRVALAANWRVDTKFGEVLLLSRPASVTVPPRR